jgi:hypothetical protein
MFRRVAPRLGRIPFEFAAHHFHAILYDCATQAHRFGADLIGLSSDFFTFSS